MEALSKCYAHWWGGEAELCCACNWYRTVVRLRRLLFVASNQQSQHVTGLHCGRVSQFSSSLVLQRTHILMVNLRKSLSCRSAVIIIELWFHVTNPPCIWPLLYLFGWPREMFPRFGSRRSLIFRSYLTPLFGLFSHHKLCRRRPCGLWGHVSPGNTVNIITRRRAARGQEGVMKKRSTWRFSLGWNGLWKSSRHAN